MKRLKNLWLKKKAAGSPAEKTAASSVKSTLLQTYFISLLCMVMCVAMFLSTSFAWFTSEVNNDANEIYVGYLNVGLYKQAGAERQDLADAENQVKLFDRSIRWEPGYTSLETVHVVNEGDLAFKYVLSFVDGALDGDKKHSGLMDVAKWFDVWYYTDAANAVPDTTSYTAITEQDSGWSNAGTLEQLLSGKYVFSGVMEDVRDEALATAPTDAAEQPNEGTTDGKAKEKTYTIALHMNEAATISAMGHKISLSVKLVAYQLASENDGFGAKYDRMVTTAEELQAGLKAGGTVALASDITLEQGVTVPKGVEATLDLNGHTISMTLGELAQKPATEAVCAIINKGNLTINDSAGNKGAIKLLFNGPVSGAAINTIRNEGALVVNAGNISNTAKNVNNQIGYGIDNYAGATLTVNGGKITASGSGYYDGIRLFCTNKAEILVTVNGGEISSIWAQNTTDKQASPVLGTVVLNANPTGKTFFENYTTVKVAATLEGVTVTPYGAGKDNVTALEADGYMIHSFVQNP